MARALSHSDQTAELHYRVAEPEKKVEGFEVVGQLVGLPATLKVDPVPATRKRRKFTAEMTSLIQREFAEIGQTTSAIKLTTTVFWHLSSFILPYFYLFTITSFNIT